MKRQFFFCVLAIATLLALRLQVVNSQEATPPPPPPAAPEAATPAQAIPFKPEELE